MSDRKVDSDPSLNPNAPRRDEEDAPDEENGIEEDLQDEMEEDVEEGQEALDEARQALRHVHQLFGEGQFPLEVPEAIYEEEIPEQDREPQAFNLNNMIGVLLAVIEQMPVNQEQVIEGVPANQQQGDVGQGDDGHEMLQLEEADPQGEEGGEGDRRRPLLPP